MGSGHSLQLVYGKEATRFTLPRVVHGHSEQRNPIASELFPHKQAIIDEAECVGRYPCCQCIRLSEAEKNPELLPTCSRRWTDCGRRRVTQVSAEAPNASFQLSSCQRPISYDVDEGAGLGR